MIAKKRIAVLVLPHQLFASHPCISDKDSLVILAEDALFFKDHKYPVNFHKQKIALHRATMKAYEKELSRKGHSTLYVEAEDLQNGAVSYMKLFRKQQFNELQVVDPIDCIVEKRIRKAAKHLGLELKIVDTPSFLMPSEEIGHYFAPLKHYAFTPFYTYQRKRLDLLLTPEGKPLGGHWTYDSENRRKAPKDFFFPKRIKAKRTEHVLEAFQYTEKYFGNNLGDLETFSFATTTKEAKEHLKDFIHHRLELFGLYQDAIVKDEMSLMHSLLSPYLNIGLLTPKDVIEAVVDYVDCHNVPLNSLEGFIRQVIGWREFVRGVYCTAHVQQRKKNFWQHHRKIPSSFYSATTGILPVDNTIARLHQYAYCHHIERLMVLGTFMLLCEFDPTEIYRWFMEMFIDAYDWVMVPNVYGMSQYADGGLMATKPYICSSNYIRKMSNYPSGEWCQIWDALFWRFLNRHKTFFSRQPRLLVLIKQLDKMDPSILKKHLEIANNFLTRLDR
ncbi:Deoxyribodipyrimidine photolyase-like protein [Chlamydiales bacterium STE3]|nr:Deoxyribodipyrimidine photolyase-like protein [Chlamydiales bacterium STE3]